MRSVSDNYQSRSMVVLCGEALAILCDASRDDWLRCSYIGRQLFRDAHCRGSAPFARIAGKVMRRLEAAGFARREFKVIGKYYNFGWSVTAAGRLRNKCVDDLVEVRQVR